MAATIGYRDRSGPRPAALLSFLILLLATAGRAEAQWGFGGYGFGFGYNQNAYTDVNYLNSRSLNNASAAAANMPKALTAPKFQTRDDTFLERYDLSTRMSMINRVARDPGREMGTADASGVLPVGLAPRTAPAPTAPTHSQAKVLLADFFDRNRRLVWPSIAPITGDLGKKQETADLSILGVLNEYELNGLAQLTNVTEARRKLLDYGRPALDYVRKQTTPAMADSFHVFLLSLYAQIELAATTPRAPL